MYIYIYFFFYLFIYFFSKQFIVIIVIITDFCEVQYGASHNGVKSPLGGDFNKKTDQKEADKNETLNVTSSPSYNQETSSQQNNKR